MTAMGGMMAKALRNLGRDRLGAILAEFAMAFPILVTLILGGVEVGRYVILQQKLHGVAVSLADLVSQAETLSVAQLDDIFLAVDHIAQPFPLGSRGVAIVSSVSASDGNPPVVNWQQMGGGTATATSLIGAPGQNATLPDGFVVRDGETVIIAEVFYNFVPFLGGSYVSPKELYNLALYRPRFGALTSLAP